MKIAIDLDDVLSDTVSSILKFYNENYEPKVKVEDLPNYSYWGFLGKTREEANEKYFAYTDSPDFISALPVGGAIEAIDELAKEHELYIITGRPFFTKEGTEFWVNKHFPGKFKDIFFTNDRQDKSNISPYWGRTKAEICDEIGAEVLIDDLPEYIRESDHLRVYLISRYWNQAKEIGGALRVNSLEEIVRDLKKINV